MKKDEKKLPKVKNDNDDMEIGIQDTNISVGSEEEMPGIGYEILGIGSKPQ